MVRAMVKDKKLLVELFQECGEKELKYVIRSGRTPRPPSLLPRVDI